VPHFSRLLREVGLSIFIPHRHLQTELNALNFALASGHKSLAQRNRIELEIHAVTIAIEYFHAALLAEQNYFKWKDKAHKPEE
jgi:hypothetical protein